MNELRDSKPLIEVPAELRERAEADGVLLLRGLLPKEKILNLRSAILNLCAESGWLAPGSPINEGVATPGKATVENEPEYMAVYDQVTRLESFHALPHSPELKGFFDLLLGERSFPHPRNIARIVFPQAQEHTTPAHQDFIHIQGGKDTWTSWIPLGDCPKELGGLAVLPRSHKGGLFEIQASKGAGGFAIDTEAMPYTWHAADMMAGDVLTFHSHTVHKALPNLSQDRLRLSVDYRFQPVSQPVLQASLEPHFGRLSWDEIYSSWIGTENQFYWKGLNLRIVEPADLYGQLQVKLAT